MSKGFVYILSNSLSSDFIKAGRSRDLKRRISEHNGTSNSIGEWELAWSHPVAHAIDAENKLLAALAQYKVKGKREQFNITAEDAIKIANGFFDPEEIRRQQVKKKERARREQEKEQAKARREQDREQEKREEKARKTREFRENCAALGIDGWAACIAYAFENCSSNSRARNDAVHSGTLPEYEISRFDRSGGFEYWMKHPIFEETLETAQRMSAQAQAVEERRRQGNLSRVEGMVKLGRSRRYVEHQMKKGLYLRQNSDEELHELLTYYEILSDKLIKEQTIGETHHRGIEEEEKEETDYEKQRLERKKALIAEHMDQVKKMMRGFYFGATVAAIFLLVYWLTS